MVYCKIIKYYEFVNKRKWGTNDDLQDMDLGLQLNLDLNTIFNCSHFAYSELRMIVLL